MIAVIADDFTGAAEIGGIGLRHGLNVVIETEIIQQTDADVLIIATDTRSLQADESTEVLKDLTQQLLGLNPDFIFKKVDSVLRGNIYTELQAQMKASRKKRSIIVPANPALKRIIRHGTYYIDGVPLDKTNFSKDPDYPVLSASVAEIIGGQNVYTCLTPKSKLPENGLILGDVTGIDDLKKWADIIDESTQAAGGSGFFDALLKNRKVKGKIKKSVFSEFGDKILYVLGSRFQKEEQQLEIIKSSGYMLSDMPEEIYFNKNFHPSLFDVWVDEITEGLKNKRKVVISVTHTSHAEPQLSQRIKENIGDLIKKVTDKIKIDELIIEGGSTTSVVLNYLNITKLYPLQEFNTGVIRMKTEDRPDFFITTKPGSYFWPENLWLKQDLNQIAFK